MELDERLREALVERDAARASERSQRMESRAILNALHAVGQTGSQQQMLSDVFDAVRPVLGFDSAFVLKPAAEGLEVYVALPEVRAEEGLALGVLADAVRGRGVVPVLDTWRIPGVDKELLQDARSALAASIAVSDVEYTLVFVAAEPGHFGNAEVGLLTRLLPVLNQSLVSVDIRDRRAAEAVSNIARFPDENPDPVLRITDQGTLIYGNAAALSLLESSGFSHDGAREAFADVLAADHSVTTLMVWLGGRAFSARIARFADAGYINLYMRDETVRIRAEAALEESFGRIQTLVQSQRFGVVFEDEQGRVVIANQAFCDMFSVAGHPADCIGRPGADLCAAASGHFLEAEVFLQSVARLRQIGEFDQDRRYELANGRIIEVSGQLVGGAPQRGGLLIQYRDVTELQRNAEALEQATLEAERANLAKSDFLAQMSHEIRTPLNALLGMTELLLHTELNESQRAYAKSVFANSEVMLALINDVLDVSKIEGGAFELIEAPFMLRELLESVVESQAARLKSGVELYTVADPRLPFRLSGDVNRLRQVLTNLVSNAVKYTDSGEVALLARLPEDTMGSHTIELVVRDTGVGISGSEQEKIFEKYGQSAKSRGGTGLGLHIVHSIVELMEGSIHLASRPGEGSTFTVSLGLQTFPGEDHAIRGKLEKVQHLRVGLLGPSKESLRALNSPLVSMNLRATAIRRRPVTAADLERIDILLCDEQMDAETLELLRTSALPMILVRSLSSQQSYDFGVGRVVSVFKPLRQERVLQAMLEAARLVDEEEDEETAVDPRGPSLRVLVVEDNADNRAVAKETLLRAGHEVGLAENGETGVALAMTDAFDVVLMDLHMPVMDGFEAILAIRKAEQELGKANVPIVAFTAHATPEVRSRAMEAGCVDFLAKPAQAQQLMGILSRAVYPKARVLVVDDAPDSRRLMQHVLLQNQILAPCCASGDEALSYLERNAVDLVLLDIEMPGRNGESTMREIVRRGWRVPVVAVTGHSDPKRHSQYRSAGFLDVAVKPIRVGKLGDQVRAWLSRFSSGPPPARQEAPTDVRVDSDLAGLIPAFLEDRRNDVRVLSQRIAAGDWDAVRRIGHSMRGTGSAYGFDKVTEIGGRVEEIALSGAAEPLTEAVEELREYLDRVRIHYV